MIEKKIKILHIVYSLDLGGIESLLIELLNRFDKEKFEIHLVILTCDKCRLINRVNNVQIHILPYEYSTILKGLKQSVSMIKDLTELLNKIQPDVVHNHLDAVNLLYIVIAMRISSIEAAHIRTIHTAGSIYSPDKNNRQKLRLYIDKIAMWAHKAHVVSISKIVYKNTEFYYRKLYKSNNLIYNGIDLHRFNPNQVISRKSDFNISNDCLVTVYVARFSKGKNQKYLIDLWKEVIKEAPKAKLYLCGDGPLLDECKKRVQELQLANNIVFLGVVSDIEKLLSISDLAVFPSLFEGFSIVLLEKLAMSLPVVASNIAPFREVINNGENSILVDLSNRNQYISSIVNLLNNSEERLSMGKKARQTAQNYSIDKTVESYENLYFNCLKN